MNLNCIKAIVFDLEGTLLDRVKSREKFIEEQYERFHDYFIHVQLADYKNKFIELDDDEDNDKPDHIRKSLNNFISTVLNGEIYLMTLKCISIVTFSLTMILCIH